MTGDDVEILRAAFPGRRIDYYETIDSTMRAANGLPLGSVVLAGQQTAGQGRHGNSWHSEAGAGIYLSMVLEPTPVLTLALGLAAVEAIAEATGLRCDLRWPNDLMLDGRKCAGILVQLADGKAIAGIGINVRQAAFPAELRAVATSLAAAGVRPTNIVIELIPAIERMVVLTKDEVLRRFAAASSYACGLRVTVQQPGGAVEGVTAGLDASGYLRLRKDDGSETLILAGGVRAAGS